MESQYVSTVRASGGDPDLATHRDKAAKYPTVGGRLYSFLPTEADAAALAPFVLNDPELRNLLASYLDLNTLTVREDYLAPDGGVQADATELSCFGRGCREEWDPAQVQAGRSLPCTLYCPHGPSHIPSNGVPRGFEGEGALTHPDGEPVGDGFSTVKGICNVDYSQDPQRPMPIADPSGQGYNLITDACPSLMTFFKLFNVPPGPSFAVNAAILRILPGVLGRAQRAYAEHQAATAAQTPTAPQAPQAPQGGAPQAPGVPPSPMPQAAPTPAAPGVHPGPGAPAITPPPVLPGQAAQAAPAPAPAAPQPQAPPAPTAQAQPPAPWADPDCMGCSTGPHPGFATNGFPCAFCDRWAKAHGIPTSGTYDLSGGDFTWAEHKAQATAPQTPAGAPQAAPAPAAPPVTEAGNAPSSPPDPTAPPRFSDGDTDEAKAIFIRDWLVKGQFTTERQAHGTFDRGLSNGGPGEALKRITKQAKNRDLLDESGNPKFVNWTQWYAAAYAITDDVATNPRKSAGWKVLLGKSGGDEGLAHNEALALASQTPQDAPTPPDELPDDWPDDPFAGEDLGQDYVEGPDTAPIQGELAQEILAAILRIDRNIAKLVQKSQPSHINQRAEPKLS